MTKKEKEILKGFFDKQNEKAKKAWDLYQYDKAHYGKEHPWTKRAGTEWCTLVDVVYELKQLLEENNIL